MGQSEVVLLLHCHGSLYRKIWSTKLETFFREVSEFGPRCILALTTTKFYSCQNSKYFANVKNQVTHDMIFDFGRRGNTVGEGEIQGLFLQVITRLETGIKVLPLYQTTKF